MLVTLLGCNDVRAFLGEWRGPRVGTGELLKVGPGDAATLTIDDIDRYTLVARLAVDGLLPETQITSIPGAAADVLAGISFEDAPLRVYLAFVAIPDGGGEALVVVSLYDDERIEVRLLRGGAPLYGIFALSGSPRPP